MERHALGGGTCTRIARHHARRPHGRSLCIVVVADGSHHWSGDRTLARDCRACGASGGQCGRVWHYGSETEERESVCGLRREREKKKRDEAGLWEVT